MGAKDPRVDAYIEKSAEFARPILRHIRKVVHAGCPEVQETMKWSFPHFEYKGILCSMASFKSHCAFGFWKGSPLGQDVGKGTEPAMGQFGRISSLADLPGEKALLALVKQAAALNDEGVRAPARMARTAPRALDVPDYFVEALRRNKKALTRFNGFNPTNKREYVEWITDAKSEDTRKRRLETAVEWIAEGKVRNWKYIR
jgi:hypothetical protein